MKRTSNPGRPISKQPEIPKAWYVCNSSDENECHEAFHLNPKQKQTSQLKLKVPQFKCVLILVQQRTPLTMQHMRRSVPLKPTNVKLRTLGEDNPAPILLARLFFGMINTPSGQMDLTRFLVLKARNAGCLLSCETLTCLGMLHVVAYNY